MANNEHLAILKQGAAVCNDWRNKNPEIRPDLSSAKLISANLNGTNIGWTIFSDNDLSVVEGLDSIMHMGPSTIGTNTLYKSKGQISEAFLRKCGLSDWEIESAKLHFGPKAPLGAFDNSPALPAGKLGNSHSRLLSPVGTAEQAAKRFGRPYGTRPCLVACPQH